jgi:hypothetical protein
MRVTKQQDIEIAIRPHPVRPAWRVLRITYATTPEHDARIVAALDAIFGPSRPANVAAGSEA